MNKNTLILIYTTIGGTVLRLLSTIIVSRALAPEAFALIGMVTTIIVIIEMVSDAGFRSYLLQHKDGENQRLLNTLWTLKVIRGFILATVLFMLAKPLSSFFEIQDLDLALMIISPLFIFNGFASLAQFIEDRENRPAKPMIIEFCFGTVVTLLAILATWLTKSVWCIVIGQAVSAFLAMLAFYIFYPQHKVGFDIDKSLLRDFFNWSKYIMPSTFLSMFIMQFDKLVLGREMSQEALGLYYLAFNLSSVGSVMVINYCYRVLAPKLANTYRLQPEILKQILYNEKHLLSLLTAFCLGLGVGWADIAVGIVYDDRYAGVSGMLSIMLLHPMLCLISYSTESLLVSMGLVRATLKGNIIRCIWLAALVYPAIKYFGVTGLIVTFSLVELPALIYFLFSAYKQKMTVLWKECMYPILFLVGAVASELAQRGVVSLLE